MLPDGLTDGELAEAEKVGEFLCFDPDAPIIPEGEEGGGLYVVRHVCRIAMTSRLIACALGPVAASV